MAARRHEVAEPLDGPVWKWTERVVFTNAFAACLSDDAVVFECTGDSLKGFSQEVGGASGLHQRFRSMPE